MSKDTDKVYEYSIIAKLSKSIWDYYESEEDARKDLSEFPDNIKNIWTVAKRPKINNEWIILDEH